MSKTTQMCPLSSLSLKNRMNPFFSPSISSARDTFRAQNHFSNTNTFMLWWSVSSRSYTYTFPAFTSSTSSSPSPRSSLCSSHLIHTLSLPLHSSIKNIPPHCAFSSLANSTKTKDEYINIIPPITSNPNPTDPPTSPSPSPSPSLSPSPSPSPASPPSPFTVILSPSALHRISFLRNKLGPNTKIRLTVDSGGCSGLEYKFIIEKDFKEKERDNNNNNENGNSDHFFGEGNAFVIDNISLPFVDGSTIDYGISIEKSSFQVINNPNAQQKCGCGSSFTPKIKS